MPPVFGASGDLAKKSTFPALYALMVAGKLPKGTSEQLAWADGQKMRRRKGPGEGGALQGAGRRR